MLKGIQKISYLEFFEGQDLDTFAERQKYRIGKKYIYELSKQQSNAEEIFLTKKRSQKYFFKNTRNSDTPC